MIKDCVVCGGKYEAKRASKTCSSKCSKQNHLAKGREYHAKNREKTRQKNREYHAKNREKINQKQREYCAKNRENILERDRERYAKNRDKIAQRRHERNDEMRAALELVKILKEQGVAGL